MLPTERQASPHDNYSSSAGSTTKGLNSKPEASTLLDFWTSIAVKDSAASHGEKALVDEIANRTQGDATQNTNEATTSSLSQILHAKLGSPILPTLGINFFIATSSNNMLRVRSA